MTNNIHTIYAFNINGEMFKTILIKVIKTNSLIR